ncbi:MAG TPA: aminotransferase class I/II-fold pyridoxal phosphate-dependent enzyme [Kofleriaceae bacterium]|nr:aminotransferase class I/II-fold pyridoxal phosphate-dependent enzyme [Kofleriaceae bacterium]
MATSSLSRKLKVAARSRIAPFIAMDVLARANAHAAAGRDVIHLEVGEPGRGAPAPVLEAARRALDGGSIGYTEALGRPALRVAIAEHCRRSYDIDLDPARVVVTVGASGAFVLGFLAMFDPGDRVIVPEPAFPAYKNILQALGIEVVRVGLGPDTDFKPTVAVLEAVPAPVHGLIVASPANPTGTMLDRSELAAIAAFCRARGIRLIADEIYHGITYEQPAHTVLEVDPDAVVVNGFSKYFCMTGWRLGWLIVPPDLVRPIELLAQNLFISAPALAQEAALAAFNCRDELDRRVETYRRSRAALLERLPRGGLDRFAPADGAFYLYADVGHLTADSHDLCTRILEDTGVALTPGADFDGENGHRFLRLAFAGDPDQVIRGAERLIDWLAART